MYILLRWAVTSLVKTYLVMACLLPGLIAKAEPVHSSQAGPLAVETIATGLDHPWALAFLPDGRLLVTERPGRMRIASRGGTLSRPLEGLPAVYARGQGGLLDVVLDRDFAKTALIYFCFAEQGEDGGHTALARARLDSGSAPKLSDMRVIFRQTGPGSSGNHYGCRIAQSADGNLFLAMGDHFGPRKEAQNIGNHLGKIVRIRADGSVPPDNPFVNTPGAKPEIWSFGHRNPQSLALHPTSGKLWEIEHGPRGGDEVNIPEKAKNYGWPVIGHGVDYTFLPIHESTHQDGMEQPIKFWVPSIAPSGMAFYTSDKIPAWRGSLFLGALAGKALVRLTLEGEKVTGEERLLTELGERIRDVRMGPDGALWLATDSASGRILRVSIKDK